MAHVFVATPTHRCRACGGTVADRNHVVTILPDGRQVTMVTR